MNLTKLEPPNLDLPNSRYGFHKIAFKSVKMNYLSNTQSLTTGVHWSAGPTCHRHRNRGADADRRGNGGAHRRRPSRRDQRHDEHHHGIAHLENYLTRPIVGAQDDGGDHGGKTARLDGDTPKPATMTQSRATTSFYLRRRFNSTN